MGEKEEGKQSFALDLFIHTCSVLISWSFLCFPHFPPQERGYIYIYIYICSYLYVVLSLSLVFLILFLHSLTHSLTHSPTYRFPLLSRHHASPTSFTPSLPPSPHAPHNSIAVSPNLFSSYLARSTVTLPPLCSFSHSTSCAINPKLGAIIARRLLAYVNASNKLILGF